MARRTVSVGETIRNAAAFNLGKGRKPNMNPDSLLDSAASLLATLDERAIDYVLVGGIALLAYVEGRNTEDIDLILAPHSLPKLPEIRITAQEKWFAHGEFRGLQIDLLFTDNPLFANVMRRHAAVRHFMERDVPTATVEGLLLLKLYALPSLYRQGNFARVGIFENDIATLLHYHQTDLTPLFEELAKHLSVTDMTSLREIVAEFRERIQRFRNGSKK